jgi:DNA-binding SARP family transcriptional activator/TolB-like protein
MYSLRTFGALVLARGGSPVEPLETQRKTLAILTVLATDGTVTRDRLMALLWPDSDIERARGSLKQAIHSLRHQLEAPDLVLGKNDLSLNPSLIQSDVCRFQDELKAGQTREAVALYQGPFLDGVHLNGSAELEQWVETRRGSLALEYRNGLERLAREAETRGEIAEAVDWCTRRAMEDPLDGKAALHLMEALAAAGQPTAALQHQRAHEELLRRELGLAPDPAILRLADRLQSTPRIGKTATPTPATRVDSGTPAMAPVSDLRVSDVHVAVEPGRIRWIAVATVILGAGGLLGWQLLQSDGQTPSPPLTADPAVAVLPFRVVGPAVEYLSEGMVDLLSFNVEGIDGLRKIDPSTVVTAWRTLGGTTSDAVDQPTALEIARKVEARYFVTGSAVRLGGDIRLVAEVRDVERGELRGTAQVTGPIDSVPLLVDQLTLELLRLNLLPSDGEHRPVSLSQVTTASLPALKAYLAGEREYRVAHWREAAQHYQRAFELDSTFGRALYRLIKASDWGGGLEGNPEYIRRLIPLIDRLPERDQMLIRADLGLLRRGDLDPVPGLSMLDSLTRRYPDDVEGWVALGERHYHDRGLALLPPITYRRAFSRALQLNPHYREPYVHLIEDAFFRLDSVGARRLIEAYANIEGSQEGCTIQMAYDLAWGSPPVTARAMAALGSIPASKLWSSCLPSLGPIALPPEVLGRLRETYLAIADSSTGRDTRASFYNLRLRMLAPRGQIAVLQQELPALEGGTWQGRLWVAGWQTLFHLSGSPDSLAAHHAAGRLKDSPHPVGVFWVGLLAAAERRWNDAEQSSRDLDRRADELAAAGDTTGAHDAKAYRSALQAYVDLLRGDSGDLTRFELAIRRLPWPGIYAPHSAYLRYEVGKLLLRQGRLRDAERYFLSFGPIDFYTSQAELFLGRINEALGRPNEAVEHYRRFIIWWQYADPSLRGPLEESRAALRRLTRGRDN